MMSYFGLREWHFSNKNIDQLIKAIKFSKRSVALQSKETNTLEFDMKAIDWNEYFVHYFPGITRYFFKETNGHISNRANQYRRFCILILLYICRYCPIYCSFFYLILQLFQTQNHFLRIEVDRYHDFSLDIHISHL